MVKPANSATRGGTPDVALTRRQKAILDFIEVFRDREGVSPTHREIRDHFGYRSYGTVYKHLRLLREKGLLQRNRYQRRGMMPVRDTDATPGLSSLPFLGTIAAGQPIEALSGDEVLPVPHHLLGGPSERHYVLRVVGRSMIDEGIHDGDFVVVRQTPVAEAGEMVVALIDGEATLKRFYPEGAEVRLQPANAAMSPIRVAADRLEIQGIVVGLMRKF